MQEIAFLVLEWYQNFKIFQRDHAHRTIHSETLGWGKAMPKRLRIDVASERNWKGGGARKILPAKKLLYILYYAYMLLFLTNQSQHEQKIKGIRNYNKNNGRC